ncbi:MULTISPECIES: imidazoleglycerol-phosphate dehydratase HisB [unclassified Adlercreutzia]|uniref:imidazoleglycerol-phosphate dehydratase HisB n=1 Tax=unclassified Adlercreutzia TaxID=2636013 RepID=UPI0013E9D9B4
MVSRTATVERTTKETDISVEINLDGTGVVDVDTGVPFFDHMLDAFGRHGLFDLRVRARGDVEVDAHHTVEDVGIVLGQAIARALGDKRGIARFGSQLLPMDEALVLAACDISGRGQLHYAVDVPLCLLGMFDTSLAKEFLIALAANAGVTLHVRQLAGENAHHLVEASFKACGRALRQACELDARVGDALPSTKGAL